MAREQYGWETQQKTESKLPVHKYKLRTHNGGARGVGGKRKILKKRGNMKENDGYGFEKV
jgi:hypothetical protein